MIDLPQLLTVEQVAERLQINPESVRRAIRAGRLACYRPQGCIRIATEQLDAYLQESLCPARGLAPALDESPVAKFQRERRFRRATEKGKDDGSC